MRPIHGFEYSSGELAQDFVERAPEDDSVACEVKEISCRSW